jgi:outer membrane lipoprotein-sorting protein
VKPRLCFLFTVTTLAASAQSPDAVLARMDQFAKSFTGAKATLRTVSHTIGFPEDEVQNGTIQVRGAGGKAEIRVDLTGVNSQTVIIRNEVAGIYHPKINEVDEYNLRGYKDIQKYYVLAFGMPGRELAGGYEIRNVKPETIEGQATTHLELIPKSDDVRKQLKSAEIWISDKTQCPVRQTFHFPDGGWLSPTYSNMQANPKFAGDAFDFPKGAKHVKVN